jgi:hypothetical protein
VIASPRNFVFRLNAKTPPRRGFRLLPEPALNRESAVMISSTIPSAKYSCSGSPDMFSNGSTAIDGLSGSARTCVLSTGGSIGADAEPLAFILNRQARIEFRQKAPPPPTVSSKPIRAPESASITCLATAGTRRYAWAPASVGSAASPRRKRPDAVPRRTKTAKVVRGNMLFERELIEQRSLFDLPMPHHDLQSCQLDRLNH